MVWWWPTVKKWDLNDYDVVRVFIWEWDPWAINKVAQPINKTSDAFRRVAQITPKSRATIYIGYPIDPFDHTIPLSIHHYPLLLLRQPPSHISNGS